MNKQELKEQVSSLPSELIFKKVMVNKDSVLELIDRLDEPQKVVIPKFVAEWFSKNPVNYWWQKISQWEQVVPLEDQEVHEWYSDYNETQFIKAWLAYPNIKIEQEKLYTVEVVGTGQYLVERYKKQGYVFIDTEDPLLFTKSELEKAGFGWVFDCNGVKVEEVE